MYNIPSFTPEQIEALKQQLAGLGQEGMMTPAAELDAPAPEPFAPAFTPAPKPEPVAPAPTPAAPTGMDGVDYDTSTPGIQNLPPGVTRDASGAIDFGPDVYAPRRGAKTKYNRNASPQSLLRASKNYTHSLEAVRDMLHYQDNGKYRDIGMFLGLNDGTSTEWDDGYAVLNEAFSLKQKGYSERQISDIIAYGKTDVGAPAGRQKSGFTGENPLAGMMAPKKTPERTVVDGSGYGLPAMEELKKANDALLGDNEWGFEDDWTGQNTTYGGPGMSAEQDWIDSIDYSAGESGRTIGQITGKGTGSMGDMDPWGKPIQWSKGQIHRGAKLGQVVSTPAGRYMVVNGADGQLALKGLKGAKHGGGQFFFNMVNKGHHVGINPKTGDVWYQSAPEIRAADERSSAAGGDFWTALQGGPNDDGVWDDERRERFNQTGSAAHSGGPASGPKWTDITWNDPGSGSFLGAYNREKAALAKRPSVLSLFEEMKDYNG